MKKNKPISLNEYHFLHTKKYKDEIGEKYIDETDFQDIENFILENEKNENIGQYLKITMKNGYGRVLQAQKYVGTLQTKSGLVIEILPKIGKKQDKIETKKILLKMLKTLKKSPFKNFNMANLERKNMPLLEIFITMFLDEFGELVKKGIKHDYIEKEENLHFMKGKFLFSQQIKHNLTHKERFFVRYEEFLKDRVENRLIKSTLMYLKNKTINGRNKQKIQEFLILFDDVSESRDVKMDFSKVQLNRQLKHYQQTLIWCETFLSRNSFTPYKDKHLAFALLFDMNKLFESYVGYWLKRNCEDKVYLQHHEHYLLEEPRKFKLKPDFYIEDKNIIADAKWKVINQDKDISQADLYQLFAYSQKYNSKKLYLIYPKIGKNANEEVLYFDKNNINDEEKNTSLQIKYFDIKNPESFVLITQS